MQSMKTFLLLFGLTVLFIFIGGAIAGQQGMIYALIFAGVINFVSYWFSDKIVLRMYRARVLEEHEAPELFGIVRKLITQAGLPMPTIALLPSPAANAFATGRNPEHATVAVTKGILTLLNHEELEGVLAHELAHVQHRDILISTIAATIAGAVMMLARMGQFAVLFGGGGGGRHNRNGGAIGNLLLLILAPISALLVQMAISRSREFAADAGGAEIAQRSSGLASALEKLNNSTARTGGMQGSPATAHMFIVHPFAGKSLFNLFSTHPPIEERIRRLRESVN